MFKININGQDFSQFRDFKVSLNYNSIASSFSFNSTYDPNNRQHRIIFKPFTFPLIKVFYGNDLLITGYIVSTTLKDSATPQYISVGGYSKTGVLEDCNVSKENYPLQFKNSSLREVVERLISPFNLNLVVSGDAQEEVNSLYDSTEIDETQTIKSYLSELVNQKNLVLSHNTAGDVLITKTNTDQIPQQDFSEGMTATDYNLVTNGQKMFSVIYAIKDQEIETDNAGDSETLNPFVDAFRPKTVKQNSGDDNDTVKVSRMAIGRMLKDSIILTLNLDRPYFSSGNIVNPNTIITVRNNNIRLRNKTRFFVQNVTINQGDGSDTAILKCVLPQCYDESPIINIFD